MEAERAEEARQSLDDVVAVLRAKERRLDEELQELEREHAERTKALRDELQKVRAGIAALSGKTAGPRERPKASVGFTKAELAERVGEILTAGPLSEGDLKHKLLELARAQGKARQGLPVLLKQVLKAKRFVLEDGAYRVV